ncbi:hypothetical protein ACFU7Y_10480 [Kitasatospora sp. NPDC057542]|uniref:hypothetical protein n=1 Tax=Kitasatospora sp. NPDC057542 TaxID=3346162 RepID=UPI0036C566C7
MRSVDRRLLIPRPVPADADPQLAELIAAAAPREMVLDLYELCAGLRALADLDGQATARHHVGHGVLQSRVGCLPACSKARRSEPEHQSEGTEAVTKLRHGHHPRTWLDQHEAGEDRLQSTTLRPPVERPLTLFLVKIRSTQDRQLLPKPLTERCYFT